jgi:molybdate transport system substrate-binding protein
MRIAILSIGLALMLSGARSDAAEVRALSVGSTQVAAKILAANFREQTGHTVAVTAIAPFMIGKQLAANPFDLLIISAPAMEEHNDDGDLRPGTRTALARVGVGVVVKQGMPTPDVSTVDTFRKAVLGAKSITYSDPMSGSVAAAALAKAGILDEVKPKTRYAGLAPGGELVARGEIELGFFNLSEIPPGATLAGPIPEPLRSYTFYEAAVLGKGAAQEPASAFVRFLASPGAAKVWRDAGLEPASEYESTLARK